VRPRVRIEARVLPVTRDRLRWMAVARGLALGQLVARAVAVYWSSRGFSNEDLAVAPERERGGTVRPPGLGPGPRRRE
jgi:hypothetical protein